MSLREEIKPYIDGNGLVAPNLVPEGTIRGSDNGPMFTSELYIILKRIGEATTEDPVVYWALINLCIGKLGLLHRAPGDCSLDAPDDYYGVLAACDEYGIQSIPRGLLNNKAQFLHVIQPQVYLMALYAAGLYRFYHFPLVIYTAGVVMTSCLFADPKQADPRRLAWLLIQVMKRHSFLGRLAAKLWERRLLKQYGPLGMRAVYQLYYTNNHPFIKYMVVT